MKISEITLDIVSQYLQFPIDLENPLEVLEFNMYIAAAKEYVSEYTGLTLNELEEISYIVPATLLLISDMVENKTLDGSKTENKTFKSFINLKKKVSL